MRPPSEKLEKDEKKKVYLPFRFRHSVLSPTMKGKAHISIPFCIPLIRKKREMEALLTVRFTIPMPASGHQS